MTARANVWPPIVNRLRPLPQRRSTPTALDP